MNPITKWKIPIFNSKCSVWPIPYGPYGMGLIDIKTWPISNGQDGLYRCW